MSENYLKYKEVMKCMMSVTQLVHVVDLLQKINDFENIDDRDTLESLDCILHDYKDVLKNLKADKVCPHCGSSLYFSDLPEYDYVCGECDESFYECEV